MTDHSASTNLPKTPDMREARIQTPLWPHSEPEWNNRIGQVSLHYTLINTRLKWWLPMPCCRFGLFSGVDPIQIHCATIISVSFSMLNHKMLWVFQEMMINYNEFKLVSNWTYYLEWKVIKFANHRPARVICGFVNYSRMKRGLTPQLPRPCQTLHKN